MNTPKTHSQKTAVKNTRKTCGEVRMGVRVSVSVGDAGVVADVSDGIDGMSEGLKERGIKNEGSKGGGRQWVIIT